MAQAPALHDCTVCLALLVCARRSPDSHDWGHLALLRETLDDTAAHYSTWMLALSDVCAAAAACTVRSRPPDGARSFMSLYSLSSGITFKVQKQRERVRERDPLRLQSSCEQGLYVPEPLQGSSMNKPLHYTLL